MSDVIGLVSVIAAQGEENYYGPGGPASVSDETRELVDREVRRIVEGCYDRARRMLNANRDRLESLTRALLVKETLDQDDAYRAAGWEPGSAPGDTPPSDMPGDGDGPPSTPPAEPPAGS
jgi:cell division protease FtsH